MSAVSIIQQPSGYLQSANNNAVWVVSGSADSTASLNFQYLADVIVNGSRVCTMVDFPNPQGFGFFDLRNITPNQVTFDFPYNINQDTSSVFHTCSNSSAQVQLSFGKQYSIYGGGFTQSRNEVSSSVFTFINSAMDYNEWVNTNLASKYLLTGSGQTNFLTKASFPIPTFNNLRSYLYFYISSSLQNYLCITTYDVNGNELGQYALNNPVTSYNGIQCVATGYPQLNTYVSASAPGIGQYYVNFGNSQLFNLAVDHYTAQIVGNSFVPYSNTITYQILTDCSRFASYAYAVYWQNSLGSFSSFLFNKTQTTTVTKTQTQAKRLPGGFNSDGTYSFNTYDRAILPFYTELETKITLSTDFLTDQMVKYLKDLYASPVIYIQGPSGNLESATIDDTNPYKINISSINENLFALSLTFNTSIQDFRQQQ